MTTSAIEGLVLLCKHQHLSVDNTDVYWIYEKYQQLIIDNLHRSRRLQAKDMHDIIADLVPLCLGNIW